MIKILCSLAILLTIAGCSSSKSGKGLAKEVCDCYEKANNLPGMDRDREPAQQKCMTLQMNGWKDIQNNKKEMDEYNLAIGQCGQTMINKYGN